MFYRPEDGWIAYYGSSNHNAIHTITVFLFQCLLRRIYIAITYNRNMHAGIVFNLSNEGPIGLSFVHLRTGSPMNSDGLDAEILQPFGNLYNLFTAVVPAKAGLYGYRKMCCFDHSFCNRHHTGNIFQQSGATAFTCYF